MDPEKNITDFDGLAEEFVEALKNVYGSGKPLNPRILSKELSERPALQLLFQQKDPGDAAKLADAYEREIAMFQSRIETLEQERIRLDRMIADSEYQAGKENDFTKRLLLILLSLARTQENEVYIDVLDTYKDLIIDNADIEHREKALSDIKNHILKHEVDYGDRRPSLKSVFKFGDRDSPEYRLKQLKKAWLNALSDLEKVLGNPYRDDILTLQKQVRGSDDYDYLLSLRKNVIDLIRNVTTDIQVEKEEITYFLLDVGEKLAAIEKEFSITTETASRYHDEDISFTRNLESELETMNESFGLMDSLEGLKSLVSSKLEKIRQSLRNKRDEFTSRIEKEREEQEKLRSTFEEVIGSVREKNRDLEEQSRMDPLTGIFNRRVFEDSIDTELDRFHRYSQPFSLIFFDLDRFKDINDRYGHEAGDKVLKAIASHINEILRKPDIFARYGGEEFVVILPETRLKQGLTVAAKLREEIENAVFEYEDKRVPVTISIGITEVRETDRHYRIIVNRADSYMYRAKERGRNRIISDNDMEV